MWGVEDFSATGSADEARVSAFCGVGPTVVFAGDLIAWGRKFIVVASFAGTAYFDRFGFPNCIMVMLFPNEGMGDFMKEGIEDIRFIGMTGEVEGDGNLLVTEVATSCATSAVVEAEGPVG